MPPKPITSTILYIGLVPFEWDEETMKSIVSGTGNIVDVRLGYDFEGKNKGFCFVEYQTVRDAQRAAQLLGSVVILQPNGSQKRLKIEGSKEGQRTGVYEQKRVLNLSRTKIPQNVRLPPELSNGAGLGAGVNNNGVPTMNRLNSPFPPTPPQQQQRLMTPPPPVVLGGGVGGASGPMGYGAHQQMPNRLVHASRNLPHTAALPFAKNSKVDENLSIVTPPQMVELIANMKNLVMTDPQRALLILQGSSSYALCAAQALLLMGFIDIDVISESQKAASSASSTPQLQAQPQLNTSQYNQPMQQSMPPQLPPQSQQPQKPQQQPQQQQQQRQGYYNGNIQYGQASAPQSQLQNVSGSRWPHLPVATQRALLSMDPSQAQLIAEALSLGKVQFDQLPDAAKTQIQYIRDSYGFPRL